MKLIKTIAILLVICVVFGGAMFALNLLTGPIIEANNAGAELAPLLAVMPEGAKFDGDALIYSPENPGALTGVGANVLSIYKEATGLGFAIRVQTVPHGYSSAPSILTIGLSADGKINDIQINEYYDSYDIRQKAPDFMGSFKGQDSTLAAVNVSTGATYSATAIKNAVSEALGALIANDLIAEGVKSPAQILSEMIPTLHTGMALNGNLKASEVAASGNIASGYKAENGSGFAYIMTEGEDSFLAIVNAMGACRVYDVEGNDVTADKAALADEAKAAAAAGQTAYADKATERFARMVEGAAEFAPAVLDSFNSVVYATSFKAGEATYYGFYSRAIGYEQMEIYVVLDENGAIVKIQATELFFHSEYFAADDNVDVSAYQGSFAGLTGETFTGENAMIAGATMTSNGMKQAAADAFAAFTAIEKGGEQ